MSYSNSNRYKLLWRKAIHLTIVENLLLTYVDDDDIDSEGYYSDTLSIDSDEDINDLPGPFLSKLKKHKNNHSSSSVGSNSTTSSSSSSSRNKLNKDSINGSQRFKSTSSRNSNNSGSLKLLKSSIINSSKKSQLSLFHLNDLSVSNINSSFIGLNNASFSSMYDIDQKLLTKLHIKYRIGYNLYAAGLYYQASLVLESLLLELKSSNDYDNKIEGAKANDNNDNNNNENGKKEVDNNKNSSKENLKSFFSKAKFNNNWMKPPNFSFNFNSKFHNNKENNDKKDNENNINSNNPSTIPSSSSNNLFNLEELDINYPPYYVNIEKPSFLLKALMNANPDTNYIYEIYFILAKCYCDSYYERSKFYNTSQDENGFSSVYQLLLSFRSISTSSNSLNPEEFSSSSLPFLTSISNAIRPIRPIDYVPQTLYPLLVSSYNSLSSFNKVPILSISSLFPTPPPPPQISTTSLTISNQQPTSIITGSSVSICSSIESLETTVMVLPSFLLTSTILTHPHINLYKSFQYFVKSCQNIYIDLSSMFFLPKILFDLGKMFEIFGLLKESLYYYNIILTKFPNSKLYFDSLYRITIVSRNIQIHLNKELLDDNNNLLGGPNPGSSVVSPRNVSSVISPRNTEEFKAREGLNSAREISGRMSGRAIDLNSTNALLKQEWDSILNKCIDILQFFLEAPPLNINDVSLYLF